MKKIWTSKEFEILRRFYPDCRTETLALILRRKASLISQKASLLGIKKSEGFNKSIFSGRLKKGNIIGEGTRFSNQRPGWNKGRKQVDYMSAENIEKTKKTQFKKGRDPHNTVPIGHERITVDGYVEVKHFKSHGKNDNFKLKQRMIYETKFGKIPKGMIVEFLDGDKLNFDISNLILRTRKENMMRNFVCDKSIVKRFFGIKDVKKVDEIIRELPEVIEQKRKTILLNQKINKEYAK